MRSIACESGVQNISPSSRQSAEVQCDLQEGEYRMGQSGADPSSCGTGVMSAHMLELASKGSAVAVAMSSSSSSGGDGGWLSLSPALSLSLQRAENKGS